jgi:uncharacterized membrane protein YjfL (UPF0719 family)
MNQLLLAALLSIITMGFVFIAKVIGDRLTPYNDDEEIRENQNVAVAIRTVGFFTAVVIGMAGALRGGAPEALKEIPIFILDGFVVLVSLLIANFVLKKITFPNVDFTLQAKNKQVSGGIIEASLFIATALILNGVFGSGGDDSKLTAGVLWTLGAQVALIVSVLVYKAAAPFKVAEELEKGNPAAGLAVATRTLCIAIILRGILDGPSSDVLKDDVTYVVGSFVFGMLLLSVINFIADLLFLKGYKYRDAVVENQNVAAVAKIAGVQLVISLVVAAVL